jgi:[ribosomal protein S5]-alanine N-acetyltransferase
MRDIITSDRLTLRPFTMADAARVCTLIGDFDVSKMLSRVAHPYTLEDAHSWLSMHPANRASGTDFPFAISTQDSGVIGAIGLHSGRSIVNDVQDAFELGYWLGKPYWGLGYATEAGRALLAAFDSDLGPRPLISRHFTENPQSGHVLKKLGFHYVGGNGIEFCVARQAEVTNRSMLRQPSTQALNPERSPTP